MKKTTKRVEIYTAEDGAQFLTEEGCRKYEKNFLEKLRNVRYFKYFTARDRTETGNFVCHNYAAVYIEGYNNCHKEVLLQHLFTEHKGKILCEGVQGYGVTSTFEVKEITKEEYFERRPNTWGGTPVKAEQIFLSEIPIENFPKNTPVISKHINYR